MVYHGYALILSSVFFKCKVIHLSDANSSFCVDGGSVGGTWLRIPADRPAVLQPGAIFRLGRHELEVWGFIF